MTQATNALLSNIRNCVTTNPEDQDLDVIHGFLSQSYWAKNIPKETLLSWIQCNRGAFVLIDLIETNINEVVLTVKNLSLQIRHLDNIMIYNSYPAYKREILRVWILDPKCLVTDVPTPAAARYCKAGQPRPPAPTTTTEDRCSFNWPSEDQHGRLKSPIEIETHREGQTCPISSACHIFCNR